LDPVPPLLPDLIELSEWLCDKYCCSRIQSLQVMLPSALKGKEEKLIGLSEWSDQATEYESKWVRYIEKEGGMITFDKLISQFPLDHQAIKKALHNGILSVRASVKDRVKIKKVRTVFLSNQLEIDDDDMMKLQKRAAKQHEILG